MSLRRHSPLFKTLFRHPLPAQFVENLVYLRVKVLSHVGIVITHLRSLVRLASKTARVILIVEVSGLTHSVHILILKASLAALRPHILILKASLLALSPVLVGKAPLIYHLLISTVVSLSLIVVRGLTMTSLGVGPSGI